MRDLSYRFLTYLISLSILVTKIKILKCMDIGSGSSTIDLINQNESSVTESYHQVTFEDTDDEHFSHFLNNRNCQCGVKMPDAGKIVGGTVSIENDWPWIAALIYTGNIKPKQFCGATLINDRYLLTAAHCVHDIPQRGHDKFKVFLGGNIIPEDIDDLVGISTIKIHPKFDYTTLDNDVALIRLKFPVTFSNTVKPVCLSQKKTPFVGENATVIGWGLTLENSTDKSLREVEVKVIQNSKCQESYEHIGLKITQSMMCASLPGKDSCKGDSGGPLIFSHPSEDSNNIRHNLIGVVSFGQRCGSPLYPGVYTRIGKLMSWIKKNTKDSFNCVL